MQNNKQIANISKDIYNDLSRQFQNLVLEYQKSDAFNKEVEAKIKSDTEIQESIRDYNNAVEVAKNVYNIQSSTINKITLYVNQHSFYGDIFKKNREDFELELEEMTDDFNKGIKEQAKDRVLRELSLGYYSLNGKLNYLMDKIMAIVTCLSDDSNYEEIKDIVNGKIDLNSLLLDRTFSNCGEYN